MQPEFCRHTVPGSRACNAHSPPRVQLTSRMGRRRCSRHTCRADARQGMAWPHCEGWGETSLQAKTGALLQGSPQAQARDRRCQAPLLHLRTNTQQAGAAPHRMHSYSLSRRARSSLLCRYSFPSLRKSGAWPEDCGQIDQRQQLQAHVRRARHRCGVRAWGSCRQAWLVLALATACRVRMLTAGVWWSAGTA